MTASVAALWALIALLAWDGGARNVAVEQERIALAWVAAFSTGDVDSMRSFRQQHLLMPDRDGDWVTRFKRVAEQVGALDVVGVLVDEPDTITVVTQDAEGQRLRVLVAFDAAARLKIAGVRFEAGDDGENELPSLDLAGVEDGNWAEVAQRLDAYVQALAQEGLFAGAVLVAETAGAAEGELGQIRFERAYGLANRAFSVPNRVETRFDVGSITKDITRVAIAQLIVAGQLTPKTKLGDVLPDYPNARARETITVEHLFQHASGLPDYFDQDYFDTPMRLLRTNADYIAIWGPKPLLFAPGTDRRYSNFGFSVLGAIIEKISGMAYPDYVAKHVFAPAGMARSGFFATDQPAPDVAVGYTRRDWQGEETDALWRNTFLEPAVGGPWGKSYSPARDLFRFWQALCGGKLVPLAFARWVLLGPLPGDTDASDGGREVPECQGQALGGGGPGLSASLRVEDGPVIIVLANLDPPIAEHLADRLVEALP